MAITNASMAVPMEFGDYLRSVREAKGFSKRQLGALAGVSNAYISQMENKRRGKKPSPGILRKLSRPLGVDYKDLMRAAGYDDDTAEEPSVPGVYVELPRSAGKAGFVIPELAREVAHLTPKEQRSWARVIHADVDGEFRQFCEEQSQRPGFNVDVLRDLMLVFDRATRSSSENSSAPENPAPKTR